MWEWAGVRPCWWSRSWSPTWLMGQDLLLPLLIRCHNITHPHNGTYLKQCQYTLHMPLYFMSCRTSLTPVYAAVWLRGSRQKVAAVDSLRQLTAAARHAPSFLSPADNWEREPAQQERQLSQVCGAGIGAGMTSTFTHNLRSDAQMYLSDIWTLMLRSDWYNLISWCTFDKKSPLFVVLFSQNCFHFRVL